MRNETFNLIGCPLFIISALGFTVSALKRGDLWALAGAVAFLVACLVFLIPFFRRNPDS